ncbi:MAG TPA: hypothetical protein VIU12_05745 [Chryseolinea sp.]
MIKYRIFLLIALCAASCKPPEKSALHEDRPIASHDSTPPTGFLPDNRVEPDNPVEIDTITVAEFVAGFRERELQEYSVDDLNYHEQDLLFYRAKRLFINDSLKVIPISGYPKSFREMGKGMKRITTLAEGEVNMNISVYTLDRFYNVIDRAVLTLRGGDETTSSEEYGKFLNDSTYSRTTLIIDYPGDGKVTADTLRRQFIIHLNGKIE